MFSGVPTRPFFRFILIATAFLSASTVLAIQVEQNDGARIEAERVTFDGTKFTLFTASGKVTVPAQQVRYLDADDSRTNLAQDAITKKEGEIAQIKSEVARLTTLVEEERKKGDEARKETETYKKRLMQPQVEPTPDPAQQAETTRLQTENARLKTENTQTLEKVGNLERQIALLKEHPKPVSESQTPPKFTLQPFTASAGKASGLTLAQGTLTNPTTESFGLVVLEVTAYDAAGQVLDTANTFLTQLEPNATRPLRANLEADPEKVKRIEATVVDVFKEAPQPVSKKKAEKPDLKKKGQKGDTPKPATGK